MLSRILMVPLLICLISTSAQTCAAPDESESGYDVVIYGGTSAGIAAAVQVKRMGQSVVVIEPSGRIGGLTTGGLGQTDIGNKAAIGGVSREFYQRVRNHYQNESSWKWQRQDQYRSAGQSRTGTQEDTMWTFEPSAALIVMQSFVDEYRIPVVYRERLDRSERGVQKTGSRITSIRMESGRTFSGKVFLDTTYEGDLLGAAGVACTVGREANAQYDETLSGVQTKRAVHHQFVPGVDPYVVKGDPSSGLLPGIDPAGPGTEGHGDRRVQAYCFRMCLTDHPDNRIPFSKPDDYDESNYELLFRNFEAGAKNIPWANSAMPNRKTDVNNNKGFSTDFIGQNYDYPEAGYEERDRIIARHRNYQRGLMWTLAFHPRVPEFVRREISRWGTCRDEFERTDGWQQQLYIREARRMIGQYVMTQHNCQGRIVADKPVGLAAYTMDSHHVQRHVGEDGFVHNEGDVQVGGFSPYPIDYGSLVPKKQQCENLLVPVCLSATHMAFGSIRMEPVFMVLGQSAATAAVHAIRQQTAVQDISYDLLQEHLVRDRQVLEWTGPKRIAIEGIDPKTLPGIVLDDESAERVGFDSVSASIGPFVGIGYRHDGDSGKGLQSAVFRFDVKSAGRYELRMAYSAHSNRATNVPVTIAEQDKSRTVRVNQRLKPDKGAFRHIAEVDAAAGELVINVSNRDTDGYVLIDAMQLLPVPTQP
ncbi:MAG: FAD-dependent oxidoreductase [Fuerstiella sp.]